MNRPCGRDEAIFTDALAQPEGRRAAFLERACHDDPALRERINALLAAHESPESLLDPPVAPRCSTPGENPGDTIGRYKLLQKIGEGGCGVVWMAEQEEPVRRRVALKIIKLGMDTKAVVARFEAERQALAMMDHANIAKVHDAGATETGRPFFVMELVRGIPITKYCDDNHLTLTARLDLFITVCHAVQHAHQKGIIHRDLKPSNILVAVHESAPRPTVIDFGIAKAIQGRLTDATLFTSFDQIIGTPAYMSPEQADSGGLDIDTRSDVYSLGVLLYELLAGRCPFDPGSLGSPHGDEIRRLIREAEPPRPSTRFSTLSGADRDAVARRRGTDPERLPLLLAGDLDWIVMKALEKNRGRRYDTPTALALDIGRHLRNEVVTARPSGGSYRVRKFIRRNRLAVTAVAAIALTLMAATAISIAQAIRATRAERVANAAGNRAMDERARADDLLTFMLEELKVPLARIGELAVLDRVIEKAMEHFTARDPREIDDATLVRHVKVLYQLGLLRMDQARYNDAEAAYREAHTRAATIVARNPRNAPALAAIADAEWGHGLVRFRRGKFEEAREWFRRERETRAALVTLEPGNPRWELELARQQGNVAAIEREHGDPELARASFRAQLDTLTKLLAARPDDLEVQRSIANTSSFLGILAEAAGDFAEASERFALQTAQLEAIAAAEPKDPHWRFKQGESLFFHAGICLITGRHGEAAQRLSRAHDLLAPLVERDGTNQRWWRALLAVELRQAQLAQAQGDPVRGAALVMSVRRRLDAMAEKEPTDVWIQYRLSMALRVEAELQHALGTPEARDAAARAVDAGERLIRREDATPTYRAERAAAGVIAARIAASQGDQIAAQAHRERTGAVLGAIGANTTDWRALDPAARLARLFGQAAQAAAIISRLDKTGYVPVEPWPEPLTTISTSKI